MTEREETEDSSELSRKRNTRMSIDYDRAMLHIFLGITFMAVDPDYQRRGVGSMLMKLFCDEVDDHNLDGFVLSSPAGVRLYSKFGFRAVGVVETNEGKFTSMLRPSRLVS